MIGYQQLDLHGIQTFDLPRGGLSLLERPATSRKPRKKFRNLVSLVTSGDDPVTYKIRRFP
jgi:hypothetical protein